MPHADGQTFKLRYFAWMREKAGRGEEMVTVPASITTVGELISWLRARGPEYELAFANPGVVRVAIDQTHVKLATRIGSAREIAFFPPVTGG